MPYFAAFQAGIELAYENHEPEHKERWAYMKLDDLIMKAARLQNKTAAVAHAEDEEVLHAIKMAIERKVARFLPGWKQTQPEGVRNTMRSMKTG